MRKISPGIYFNVFVVILLGVVLYAATGMVTKPASDTTKVDDTAVIKDNTTVKTKKYKNIIFMIGDGMGLTQVTAGYYANKKHLNLQRCKVIGLMTTDSKTSIITDSAAGATAMATGKKTRNLMMSMAHEDSAKLKTILEYAEDHDLATGVVATSSVTHATPGSFYGHVPNRNATNEKLIGQFVESGVEVLMGGGKKYFVDRTDKRNIVEELEAKGYAVIDSLDQPGYWGDKDKLVCLISDYHPIKHSEGRGDFLTQATSKSIDVLNKANDNGFFLMVEGSQIDWGGHARDSDYIIEEMIDFDRAVKAALDFAEKDGNTLVVITADHETGGYAIHDGIMSQGVIRPGFTTDYHTCTMVPVFAFGPEAEKFQGMFDNTDIFHKMMEVYGFSEDGVE